MKGKFRILIVDDEDNILRSLSSMMADCSGQTYQVSLDTATNNRLALQRFKDIPFDLVSLDMNMPDFDGQQNVLAGIQLLEALREIDPTLPLIILSGEDESTIRTMLQAKNLENYDVFLKNKSSGTELCRKVSALLHESEIGLLAAGETEPHYFKRQDMVNLQAVVSSIEANGEAHISIIEREDTLPDLAGQHWRGIGSYGLLRQEPVDVVGVRDNRLVVISSSEITFLEDFYRNKILTLRSDLNGLTGKVVDFKPDANRIGVEISSAPAYLTAKKFWRATADTKDPLPIGTEVDILGETSGRLNIRRSQTWIANNQGEEFEIVKSTVVGLIGKVVRPLDEENNGRIEIVSENAPDPLGTMHWQVLPFDKQLYIPGELVEVVGVHNKKLLVQEHHTDK